MLRTAREIAQVGETLTGGDVADSEAPALAQHARGAYSAVALLGVQGAAVSIAPHGLGHLQPSKLVYHRTAVAASIVQGMCHLHASQIVHGDLKPQNVLLKSSRSDRRGFIAKVGSARSTAPRVDALVG